MNKHNFFSLFGSISLAALIASCGGSGNPGQMAMPPAAVTVFQVSPKSVTGLDTYPATVVAANEVEIRPQVSGYITNIFVQDGQEVTKGQRLYEIDRSKYQAARNQAAATLAAASRVRPPSGSSCCCVLLHFYLSRVALALAALRCAASAGRPLTRAERAAAAPRPRPRPPRRLWRQRRLAGRGSPAPPLSRPSLSPAPPPCPRR
jgi:multidrug efflux pump subunit AcrA (membrane-fusion protein)